MPLTNTIHDSLPYIDNEATPQERNAAQALIDQEMGTLPTEAHPSLPPLQDPDFTLVMQDLFASKGFRMESKKGLGAIDLSRYESLDAPSSTGQKDAASLKAWREALQASYTAHAFLSNRSSNLSSLDEHGKNAWLLGNAQLEEVLKGLERELQERKEEIDRCVIERKNAQEAVGGEMKGLEETWRRGVGRVLETEVAAEGVRREILERRRQGAS